MKLQFFGASDDIVKKSLIVWAWRIRSVGGASDVYGNSKPGNTSDWRLLESLPVCLAALAS